MFNRSSQGAIDAKIASKEMIEHGFQANIICGPTTSSGLHPFVYDEAFPGLRPPGSANLFNFSWVYMNKVEIPFPPSVPSAKESGIKQVIIGVCIGVPTALIAVAIIAKVVHGKRHTGDGAEYRPLQ
jgi:hypothetical protein